MRAPDGSTGDTVGTRVAGPQASGQWGKNATGPYDMRYFFGRTHRQVNDTVIECHAMAYTRAQTFERASIDRNREGIAAPPEAITHLLVALLPTRLPCDVILSGPNCQPRQAAELTEQLARSFLGMMTDNVMPDVVQMHRKAVAIDLADGGRIIDRVSSGPAMDPVFLPNLFRSGAIDVVPKQFTSVMKGGKDNGAVQRYIGRYGPANLYETAWDAQAPGTGIDREIFVGGLRSDLSTSLHFGVAGRLRPYWFTAFLGHRAGTLAIFHYPIPMTFGGSPAPCDLSLTSVDYILGAVMDWGQATEGSYPTVDGDGPCLTALRAYQRLAPQASYEQSTPLRSFYTWPLLPVHRALRTVDGLAGI